MIKVQALSCPCWKICIWMPEVKRILDSYKYADILRPQKQMKNLAENIDDVLKRQKFKGQKLVEGWMKESHDETTDNWVARDPKDCAEGLKQFATNLTESLDCRYINCVKELCHLLTANYCNNNKLNLPSGE